MIPINIESTYSVWWLIPALVLAVAGAYWLYHNKESLFTKPVLTLLKVLRVAAWMVLAILLINPLIKSNSVEEYKPAIVFAIDNSKSVAIAGEKQLNENLKKLKSLAEELKSAGLEVRYTTFGGNVNTLDSLSFKTNTTDLKNLITGTEEGWRERNLSAIVLVSDGINNSGINPGFLNLPIKIHSVGLGDTIAKKDIVLKAVVSNKIAFSGNKFPIVAEINQRGYSGETVNISLTADGKPIATKNLKLGEAGSLSSITFFGESTEKGVHQYEISVQPLNGEFTTLNNKKSVYIEIIDGKQKILIASAGPHPDLKALRSAIELTNNYEVVNFIQGFNELKPDKYSLIILHQLPESGAALNPVLDGYIKGNTPLWVIGGMSSNYPALNNLNLPLSVSVRGNQSDKVRPEFNQAFTFFALSEDEMSRFAKFPPLMVPYGEAKLNGESTALLSQKVGNINTGKPMLAFGMVNGKKVGYLLGEGIWEWRLQEYGDFSDHKSTDALIKKTVQYLTTKEDKRKYRVLPLREEFDENERVTFNVESYNNLYEPVFGITSTIDISGPKGKRYKFGFTANEGAQIFDAGILLPGVYSYIASATLNGKAESYSGRFIVTEYKEELMNLTANHSLLREVAANHKGIFAKADNLESLAKELKENPPAATLVSFEDTNEAINLPWIFFIFLLLVSTEWVIRKLNGSY